MVLQHPRLQELDLPIGMTPADALMMFAVLAPLARRRRGGATVIALQAHTFKEAQTKLSMLIFLPMIPGFLFAFGTLQPAPWMAFAPMIGQHMLITTLVRGETLASARPSAVGDHPRDGGRAGCAAARQFGAKRCCGGPRREPAVAAESRDDRCIRLLQEHDRALRRMAASYERDPSRRQDLVQDIWLAVWQALPRFRNECSERTFVFRIAHNRAVSHVDHWQRRQTDLLDETPRCRPGTGPGAHVVAATTTGTPAGGRAGAADRPAPGRGPHA